MKNWTEFQQVCGIATQTEFINVVKNGTRRGKALLRNLASCGINHSKAELKTERKNKTEFFTNLLFIKLQSLISKFRSYNLQQRVQFIASDFPAESPRTFTIFGLRRKILADLHATNHTQTRYNQLLRNSALFNNLTQQI